MSQAWPVLGCGLGLRSPHYSVIRKEWPRIDWFEAISENYMDSGGRPLHILQEIRGHYPIALHGTALSIGSIDPLDQNYLSRLKRLVDRIEPFIVSDHLCWSGVKGEKLHDLLPLPLTEEAIQHVVSRIQQVQDFLGRKILVENVSTYVTYKHSTMPEWEFLREVARRSGSGILLDLNNIYVNSKNHQFDPYEYVRNIPADLVGQIHLGGHTNMGSFLFDTHSKAVIDPVWDLYREALSLMGQVSTLIEWDADIPPFEKLKEEADRAREIYESHCEPRRGEAISSSKDCFVAGAPRNDNNIPLLKVQEWFKTKVQPKEKETLEKLSPEPYLNPSGDAGKKRVAAYAGGYPARILESLGEVYEAVYKVLGEKAFGNLVYSYACHYPSHDYNLTYVGRHLPEFLKTSLLLKDFPYLVDLATLEWAISQAFHSFEEALIDAAQITSISPEDWEKAQIVFQPSLVLVASEWSILEIWLKRHETLQVQPASLLKNAQRILVGRRDLQVRCELLDENQFQLMSCLLQGLTLGDACEKLAETTSDESLPISEWFSRWIQDGLIIRCLTPALPKSLS